MVAVAERHCRNSSMEQMREMQVFYLDTACDV